MPDSSLTAHTLSVPGARLYYERRGTGPLLLLIGSPMDSTGFAGLATALAHRYTIVTYDPRGIGNSSREDATHDVTPGQQADDVQRLLAAHGDAPADVFGSSGGAVRPARDRGAAAVRGAPAGRLGHQAAVVGAPDRHAALAEHTRPDRVLARRVARRQRDVPKLLRERRLPGAGTDQRTARPYAAIGESRDVLSVVFTGFTGQALAPPGDQHPARW